MAVQMIPVTPEGYKKLVEELKKLKSVDRPENIADIEKARAQGDLSENAEYSAAKERQSFISFRIGEVENMIARAQVIDPATMDTSKIVFGATVKLKDVDSGEEVNYQIVGKDEFDIKLGRISVESPIAKSLIGKELSDVVRVVTPRGHREFEVLEILYK
jgi:transcription elongation factor GreA